MIRNVLKTFRTDTQMECRSASAPVKNFHRRTTGHFPQHTLLFGQVRGDVRLPVRHHREQIFLFVNTACLPFDLDSDEREEDVV